MQTDSRPRILMIGAERYGMDACLRLGLDDDQANPEHILTGLYRAGLADAGFDAVYTSDEYALVAVALIAEHFGCRTSGPAVAAQFRDKSLQKAKVAAAGIKTARITVIEDIFDVSGLDELPYPRAVLKPVAGAATSRTSVVNSLDDLRARSREYAAARIPQRVFALEEFVPGDEWIVDGVVFDGEIVFAGVGAYGDPCLTTVDKDLPLTMRRFDPVQDAEIYAKALPTAAAALSALGLRDSVFHMELFHDPATGELYFGECAARRGGGLVHEEVQAKFNVHLGECAMQCALGVRPQPEVKVRPGGVTSGYLSGRAGTLIKCPTPSRLRELPGIEFARIESSYGTVFEEGIGTTNQRIGLVLATGETPQEAADRLAAARVWFAEQSVVIPPGTRQRVQRGWQAATWPDEDFRDNLWA